jgi:hypothetical protein
MTLLVNGCSFSYGDELQNPEEERYSTHLGKLLDIDVINKAWPGSSNERIWRTTKEQLFEDRNITKCLILWSDVARVENIHLDSHLISHEWDMPRPDPFFQFSPARLGSDPWRALKTEYEDYYSNVYTNETGISKTFFYMYDIVMTCKLLNIDYYQGWFHQGNKYTISKTFNNRNLGLKTGLEFVETYVNDLKKKLTGNQSIGFDSRSLSFNEFTEKNNLDKMPLGHPGPKAHEEYAKYLYDNFMR